MEKMTVLKLDEVDLTNILRQVIREEIKSVLVEINCHSDDDTLLTRKEVSQMLHISLPTLHQFQKNGRIPFYRIGGRVLYKKGQVLKAIELPIKYRKNYKS